jgi:Animal haem peroxidase
MTQDNPHGQLGTREQSFVRLVEPAEPPFDDAELVELATMLGLGDKLNDGKDGEENLYVPAGYTYLGQFVDHDLTFDTTSTLNPKDPTSPTNVRTPSLDLDCVYGGGPADQPFMYLDDGATLRIGKTLDGSGKDDLPRVPEVSGGAGRAIIGDKRNDENSIVSQIQLAFLKFHNKVVANQKPVDFVAARNEVRWTYQRMLVEDYLRRIVEAPVYDAFVKDRAERGDNAYRLFVPGKRINIPLEFAGAAYRFGHSMVRFGYRLNRERALPIFVQSGESDQSLTGFQALPGDHVIDDWGRFFPALGVPGLAPGQRPEVNRGPEQREVTDGGKGGVTAVRLQFAYKIDPNLTAPLNALPQRISDFAGGPKTPVGGVDGPALSLLNLRRGNKFGLASGQRVASALCVDPLTYDELMVRTESGSNWTFKAIPESLRDRTPLWLYVLAEAQRKIVRVWADPTGNNKKDVDEDFFLSGEGAVTQLGPVGGRLVLETFFGLLDADPNSYVNAAPDGWQPPVLQGGEGPVTFSHILLWTGLTLTDGFPAQ